ncbi:hypothetical protein AWV63_26475 [Micromonospora rifamycinica]|uniref:Uncharacterized protein n=1 Tax=Micromonospora rifamycinica TaxID=291594 RepID=A0A109IFY2_9ACTN|nr:hypothetical protein AWV63_26475 [Micromonospora rifamycinica]SCG81595.1 hypothetical protein GA0070623_5979 [Micromonospora rifamycinica]
MSRLGGHRLSKHDGPLREQRTAQLPAIRKAKGNKMTVRQRRAHRPPDEGQEHRTPSPLPLRWVVIMALSAAIGIMVGTTESLPAGMVASLITVGGLHKIMD